MKSIIFLIFVLFSTLIYSQKKNSFFDTVQIDAIKIYVLDTNLCNISKQFINKEHTVNECFKFVKVISNKDFSGLYKVFNRKRTYGNSTYSCGKDIGILFERKGNYIAHIEISLDCDNLFSNKSIPILEELKMYAGTEGAFIYPSFSKKGKLKILKLLNKIGIETQENWKCFPEK
jgi:hypothetical protein